MPQRVAGARSSTHPAIATREFAWHWYLGSWENGPNMAQHTVAGPSGTHQPEDTSAGSSAAVTVQPPPISVQSRPSALTIDTTLAPPPVSPPPSIPRPPGIIARMKPKPIPAYKGAKAGELAAKDTPVAPPPPTAMDIDRPDHTTEVTPTQPEPMNVDEPVQPSSPLTPAPTTPEDPASRKRQLSASTSPEREPAKASAALGNVTSLKDLPGGNFGKGQNQGAKKRKTGGTADELTADMAGLGFQAAGPSQDQDAAAVARRESLRRR
ncbi:hypothetical protein A0H81_06592 [Grifola frondosa]|uniref:Uncharacterized protein n=1 Tax=Grifola frondosa TaxID=5627 RepID=A0A1C7M8M8_GRIFR|nr:hypothetical protein A0H81_06592 [Grifola frondosa]